MFFRRAKTPPPLQIKPHVVPAFMLQEAASALPSEQLCNAIYTAIADKPDVKPEHLEILANRLGRLAHERNR
ncbi:MAG: hypothetical protein ACPG4F_04600 [Paracoccaceae bacterium]